MNIEVTGVIAAGASAGIRASERQDDLLALAQPVDGSGQDLLHLLDLEDGDRPFAPIGDAVAQCGAVAAAEDVVERHQADERDLLEGVLQLLGGHAQLAGDLGIAGRAQQVGLELGVGGLDGPGLGAD